jgi:broad-specificity NMP kinase
VDPAHALWIGGPQGSGKTSIAAALADRFGLQLYHVDARTWVHEARMPPTEFSSLTMDQRWVHPTPETMLGWFVTTSRHRFRLVLEDLRELPDEPACIVEGPQLFPTSVSAVLGAPDQALFLLPDLDEMRERLRARGPMQATSDGARARENAVARDVLIAQTFAREARELRLSALQVDAPLDVMIERAAAAFAPAVERLPRGGDVAAVRAFEAEVGRTQVRLYHEWLERAASGEAGTSR